MKLIIESRVLGCDCVMFWGFLTDQYLPTENRIRLTFKHLDLPISTEILSIRPTETLSFATFDIQNV